MRKIDIQTTTEVARTLFQGARTIPSEHFQNWAIEQVLSIIHFDSAIWSSGVNLDGRYIFHGIHLYNQPPGMLENYARYAQGDILTQLVVESPGKTVCPEDMMPREEIEKLDIYRYHCKPFGLVHTITTVCLDPDSNILGGISLYRKDFDKPFSEDEKTTKQFLMPLLVEARNLNIFLHLNKTDSFEKVARAICDIKGILLEVESVFSELIRREWPDWKGPQLPVTPESIMGSGDAMVLTGERIVLHLQSFNELIEITAREKNVFDSLTQSEQLVAKLLTEGLSNKEIANVLSISPKTVSNHLHNIYAKLGVPSRQRVTSMLKEGMYRMSATE